MDLYGELLKAPRVWGLWWTRGTTNSHADTHQTRPLEHLEPVLGRNIYE